MKKRKWLFPRSSYQIPSKNYLNSYKEGVTIYVHRYRRNAVLPKVAYEGTSAAFDLVCIEDTVIPAGGSAMIPNGLHLIIDQKSPYYMRVSLRSSKGFKEDLIPHYGIIDAGYCGNMDVKVYNMDKEDVLIERGEKYAQITVHHKPSYFFEEINDREYERLLLEQERGEKGFGSSGK